MGHAAIGLSILGFAVGVVFRLKILLLTAVLLLLVSIVFSLVSGFGFLNAVVMIMVAQTIFQASYFLGLVARAVFSAHRVRPVL